MTVRRRALIAGLAAALCLLPSLWRTTSYAPAGDRGPAYSAAGWGDGTATNPNVRP